MEDMMSNDSLGEEPEFEEVLRNSCRRSIKLSKSCRLNEVV